MGTNLAYLSLVQNAFLVCATGFGQVSIRVVATGITTTQ